MISVLTRPICKIYGEDRGFEIIANAGFDAIDYSMHLLDLDDPLFDQPIETIYRHYEMMRNTITAQGLTVCQMHTLYPTYWGDQKDKRRLQATRAGLAASGGLNCSYAVVHPMIPESATSKMDADESWQINRNFYTSLISLSREYDVQVAIENMFSWENGKYIPNQFSTAKDMVTYIDRLNDIAGEERFVACYDTGHAHLLGNDLYEEICTLGKRLKILHLHDNAQEEDAHTKPYLGTINWYRVMQALRAVAYRGPISFEAHGFIVSFPPDQYIDALKELYVVGQTFEKVLHDRE